MADQDAVAALVDGLNRVAEYDELTQDQAAQRVIIELGLRGWAVTKLMDRLEAEPYETARSKTQEDAAYSAWGISLAVLDSILSTFIAHADEAYINEWSSGYLTDEDEPVGEIEPVQ